MKAAVFLCLALLPVGFCFATESQGDGAAKDKKPLDAAGGKEIWTLTFKSQNPRTIKVTAPGSGEKTIWYIRYEVANSTAKDHTFTPLFHLWSDKSDAPSSDRILPWAEEKIRASEDPKGTIGIRNSLTISAQRIPPRTTVHGAALWDSVPPDATSFLVYVRGLSNGHIIEKERIWHKTLELRFRRVMDPKLPGGDEIRPVGVEEWVYRETRRKNP